MNTSSASSHTTPSIKMPRHGWMAVMSLFLATAVTTLCLALSGRDDGAPVAASRAAERPLFGGWVKHGSADFGQDKSHNGAISTQPRWVLATEPSNDEVKDLQSALAGHPDKVRELDRLIDYSRFQKQVALWNELQNGPMNSERATLSEHLLEVLPAHYGRGELMGPQALLMAQALVKDLEPDAQLQSARLAETKSQLAKQAPTIAQEELNAQKTFESFEQQQQQRIVSDHAMLDNTAITKTP